MMESKSCQARGYKGCLIYADRLKPSRSPASTPPGLYQIIEGTGRDCHEWNKIRAPTASMHHFNAV